MKQRITIVLNSGSIVLHSNSSDLNHSYHQDKASNLQNWVCTKVLLYLVLSPCWLPVSGYGTSVFLDVSDKLCPRWKTNRSWFHKILQLGQFRVISYVEASKTQTLPLLCTGMYFKKRPCKLNLCKVNSTLHSKRGSMFQGPPPNSTFTLLSHKCRHKTHT